MTITIGYTWTPRTHHALLFLFYVLSTNLFGSFPFSLICWGQRRQQYVPRSLRKWGLGYCIHVSNISSIGMFSRSTVSILIRWRLSTAAAILESKMLALPSHFCYSSSFVHEIGPSHASVFSNVSSNALSVPVRCDGKQMLGIINTQLGGLETLTLICMLHMLASGACDLLIFETISSNNISNYPIGPTNSQIKFVISHTSRNAERPF
jgi:hypothetical protein